MDAIITHEYADFFVWLSGLGDDDIMRIWKRDTEYAEDHHYVKKFDESERNGAIFYRHLDLQNQALIIARYKTWT